jgi:hypothetical protein
MGQPTDIPKGIWYEKGRNRWRVKLVRDRVLIHRSYHREYDEALSAWTQATNNIVREVPKVSASLINQFLCQPLL